MTSRRLVVALDVTPLLGARTGVGQWVAGLLDALRDLPSGEAPRLVPYLLSLRARRDPAGVADPVRRLPVPAGVALRWWGRWSRPALDGVLEPATVVHGTNFIAPPSRRRGVVITVHDCAFARTPEQCPPAVRAFRGAVKRAVDHDAWVHTHTNFVAAEVKELFGAEQVRVIPPGVPALAAGGDVGPAVRTASRSGPYVLVLGAHDLRKQPARAVEAFAAVATEIPDLRLVLAGSGAHARPVIDDALGRLRPDDRGRVLVLGHVGDAERSALLKSAAVLLHPSPYEGFGLPVLEAMATGVPVVAAPAAAVVEVAGGAACFPGDDAGALADGLRSVLSDESQRQRLVAAGHARANRFDWRATARAMVELYREAAP